MEPMIPRFARIAEPQSGVALIMVLIMLTAMTIAGVALMRIADSANVISGNFAFRQATLNIADLGIEAAAQELVAEIIDKNLTATPYPAGCTTECRYFPARSVDNMLDAKGLPTMGSVDGTLSQDISWRGNDVNTPPDPQREPENPVLRGYRIRYVIDRQCEVSAVTDPVSQCLSDTPQSAGSKKAGATVFSTATTVFYRVSIQVTGPRNTKSHVQVMLNY